MNTPRRTTPVDADAIEVMIRDCLELVVALLPEGDFMPRPRDARDNGVQLMQRLCCVLDEIRGGASEAAE
jgi:hypothetical protein